MNDGSTESGEWREERGETAQHTLSALTPTVRNNVKNEESGEQGVERREKRAERNERKRFAGLRSPRTPAILEMVEPKRRNAQRVPRPAAGPGGVSTVLLQTATPRGPKTVRVLTAFSERGGASAVPLQKGHPTQAEGSAI